MNVQIDVVWISNSIGPLSLRERAGVRAAAANNLLITHNPCWRICG